MGIGDVAAFAHHRMVEVKTFDMVNGHIRFQMFVHSKSVGKYIGEDENSQIEGLGDCDIRRGL